jgi:hypothetical protein
MNELKGAWGFVHNNKYFVCFYTRWDKESSFTKRVYTAGGFERMKSQNLAPSDSIKLAKKMKEQGTLDEELPWLIPLTTS